MCRRRQLRWRSLSRLHSRSQVWICNWTRCGWGKAALESCAFIATVRQVKIPRVMLASIRRRVLDHMSKHPATRVIRNLSGDPYLNRWELLGNHRMFDIYLHEFLRSDDNRALHDHPGVSIAIVLQGKYVEWFRAEKYKLRTEGEVVLRRAATPHRIQIIESAPRAITVFLRGPKLRDWGFHCADGWRHHSDFHIRGCGT